MEIKNNFYFKQRKPIEVFARVNEDGFIVEVASSIFLKNTEGWKKIDEGFGDKFAHAQNEYFSDGLVDEGGKYIHKLN